ncbi:MAG: glycoside hydrolase family 3 C-terminal domain-containing protein, partial [Acidobacteriota bacterium]
MTQRPDEAAFPGIETDTVLPDEEIEALAHDLIARLTLDEKISLMDGDPSFWTGMAEMFSGGYANHPWNAGVRSRLGIPGIRFLDGPRGVVMEGATTFPVSMARGATWDVELEEQVGDAIGREVRALGGNLFAGVCINLLRHPAWGRAQETYGEDPHHLGEMGAALVRGVQRHAMACAKHFALNSMENARFKVNVSVGERALHEIYLAHFKRVVDEGVAAIMSAYNSVNGEWCGQSRPLLTDILKRRWRFRGFVMTDFIFGMRDAHKAALAGQDLEMPFQMHYHRNLKRLVESGDVAVERIDEAARRLLRQQIRLARPGRYSADDAGCERHRKLAREVARKSIVLLKNEGSLLPLRDVSRIAVIGRLAGTPNTGDSGSSNTRPEHVVTPLEGIRIGFEETAEILYDGAADPADAAKTARSADVAILVVGYTHDDEGEYIAPDTMQTLAALFPPPSPEEAPLVEKLLGSLAGAPSDDFCQGGDRDRLTLSAADEQLIQTVADANPRTVVAVMGGSAVIMESWRARVPAILMLWYPGMEGGHALADILSGRVNPSGRLPFAVPERAEDLPVFDKDAAEIEYDLWHGYRKLERDGRTPAFPFGFGLSYSRYQFAGLRLAGTELSPADTLEVFLEISNQGDHAGEEVVQLYVSALGSVVERAPKDLKAFTRVALQRRESRKVQISVPISRLAYYDEARADFVVEPIEYEVFV